MAAKVTVDVNPEAAENIAVPEEEVVAVRVPVGEVVVAVKI